MQGNPQLELDMPATEGFELVTARFLPRVGEEESREAPVQFNFSPTVAFAGKRFVLASTEDFARKLAAAASAESSSVNTFVEVRGASLHDVLADNVPHLVAKNMLEEGHTREEAERQIDLFLQLVDAVQDVRLELTNRDHQLGLEFSVRLTQP